MLFFFCLNSKSQELSSGSDLDKIIQAATAEKKEERLESAAKFTDLLRNATRYQAKNDPGDVPTAPKPLTLLHLPYGSGRVSS